VLRTCAKSAIYEACCTGKKVLRTNAASSAKKLSAQVLCTSAAHMREHALPAFVRTLNARRLSSFSALIECDLKFTCSAFFFAF
jgi:hypothetical protein